MLATSCRPPYQGELGATWITVTALVHRYHRSTNIKVYRGILIYNIYIYTSKCIFLGGEKDLTTSHPFKIGIEFFFHVAKLTEST